MSTQSCVHSPITAISNEETFLQQFLELLKHLKESLEEMYCKQNVITITTVLSTSTFFQYFLKTLESC